MSTYMAYKGMALIDFVPSLFGSFGRGSDIESPYLGSMVVFLILAVLAFVIKPEPRE